ncbi:MAG: hypothetical protein LBC41_11745 [Clostridiales bacterium]|jgi:hypothetical protein|nr:hypothetical protein [Clostridiales bacterium]
MKKMLCALNALGLRAQGLVAGILIGGILFTSIPALAEVTKTAIEVTFGTEIFVNGKKLDVKDANGDPAEAINYNDTTYLPVRSVSESLGVQIGWNAENGRVEINPPAGNFSDEMKIPYSVNHDEEYGSDSYERIGDHKDSPYFNKVDFFNAKSNDHLTILEGFKTQQQTSEWSCGVSSALMVLDYFDKLGDNNEDTLSALRGERQGRNGPVGGKTPGATNLRQMIDIFDGIGGFETFSTFDCEDVDAEFTQSFIRETITAGNPIMVGWNAYGAHWQTIIGYDTMGTPYEGDDVIVLADPYDTIDHNQDGYVVYPAEGFIYNFDFLPGTFPEDELNHMCFVVASVK